MISLRRKKKKVEGPEGVFYLTRIVDGDWCVHVTSPLPRTYDNTRSLGAYQIIKFYATYDEALESARRFAHGIGTTRMPEIPTEPLPDRRGLVAHSRNL